MLLHATCIAIEGRGVLLAGPAGVGKSDLALRFIDQGAELVSDDQTDVKLEGKVMIASAPASIAGLFEVRHVGLLKMPFRISAEVALYVDLVSEQEKLERLPEHAPFFLLDHPIPRLRLPAFAASTPAKIRAALNFLPAT